MHDPKQRPGYILLRDTAAAYAARTKDAKTAPQAPAGAGAGAAAAPGPLAAYMTLKR